MMSSSLSSLPHASLKRRVWCQSHRGDGWGFYVSYKYRSLIYKNRGKPKPTPIMIVPSAGIQNFFTANLFPSNMIKTTIAIVTDKISNPPVPAISLIKSS